MKVVIEGEGGETKGAIAQRWEFIKEKKKVRKQEYKKKKGKQELDQGSDQEKK